MPLPIGRMYQEEALGAGTVGSIEVPNIDAIHAGEDLNYGIAVQIKDGVAVVANKAPIFGITTKRGYAIGNDYNDIKSDHFYQGERIGVLTRGSVSVPITDDVDKFDPAAINADGTFKSAQAGDTIVGRFITAGDKDSTAIVQVNLTEVGSTAGGASTQPSTPTNPSSSTQPTTPSSNSKQTGGK